VKKKATIYTSAVLNGSMLLTSIDAALWLHKSDGFTHITIYSVLNYNPFNFFTLPLRLKNLTLYLKVSKFKKYWNRVKPTNSDENHSDLSKFANGKIDSTNLKIFDLEINFVRLREKNKNSFRKSITLSYRVAKDYLNYFNRNALEKRIYLNYKLANINAGLHVLSEALRSDYKSFGSIFYCRLGILAALYKLHISLEQYKSLILLEDNTSFVCGVDQEYLYGFFSRYMSNQGAKFIELNNIQLPYIKLDLNKTYYSRLNIFKIGSDIEIPDKEKIYQYYKKRIEKPWEVFNYKEEKYSSKKNILKLNEVSVILYLHSFTDAQYVYGYDGYHDLMDWCLTTISILNSNKHVSKVIIKPHPESTSSYHPGDSIANNYLKSKISSFEKVAWADFHFGVNNIISSDKVIGISHHGSVTEELVFNKFPVIASSHSSWGDKYKFGYWWNDKKDYEKLISSKLISELQVTQTQTDELYRYANDFYFTKNSHIYFNITSTWKDIFETFSLKDSNEHGENVEQIIKIVNKINPEDQKFKRYIATRLNRINLLVEQQNK
tara:strand:+ start:11056 stop:12705 length:1650 start_codon:yes stop_codon:yes gene_type:complete